MAVSYPQTRYRPPPESTRVVLVRHGQSEPAHPERPFPLVDGHGDPKLTELGHRQAEATANKLKSETFDAIYVSPLTRTHQTAAPLAEDLGIEPTVITDLREVFLGEWEGGLFRHMMHTDHEAVAQFRRTLEWASVPGAETNAALIKRTSNALSGLRELHRGEKFVCFVHGGVIAALLAHATGGDLAPFAGSDNAALHRLVITDARWTLRCYNDIGHLDGLLTPSSAQDQPA